MNVITTPPVPAIDTPKKPLRSRSSGLTLWRPGIVLARAPRPVAPSAPVALGEPGLRPDAVRAQITATRTLLETLAETRSALDAEAVEAKAHPGAPDSEAGRVVAMMQTYQTKTRLDNALRVALREITALMEERGLK